jgi:hypothetical protein
MIESASTGFLTTFLTALGLRPAYSLGKIKLSFKSWPVWVYSIYMNACVKGILQ